MRLDQDFQLQHGLHAYAAERDMLAECNGYPAAVCTIPLDLRQSRLKWVIMYFICVQRIVLWADGHGAQQAVCSTIVMPEGFGPDEATAVAAACDLQA